MAEGRGGAGAGRHRLPARSRLPCRKGCHANAGSGGNPDVVESHVLPLTRPIALSLLLRMPTDLSQAVSSTDKLSIVACLGFCRPFFRGGGNFLHPCFPSFWLIRKQRNRQSSCHTYKNKFFGLQVQEKTSSIAFPKENKNGDLY